MTVRSSHAAFALMTALTLSGLGPGLAQAKSDASAVISVGLDGQYQTFNPIIAYDTHSAYFARNLFEGLVRNTGDEGITPAMAERWTISEDGLTYRFLVREGLRWSDGTPITAQMMAQSFQRLNAIADNSTFYAFDQAVITAEMVEGREWLVFKLPKQAPEFLGVLGAHSSVILPMHLADQLDFNDRWADIPPEALVYSGPYMVTSVTDDLIALRPNPHYHSPALILNDGVDVSFQDERKPEHFGAILDGTLDFAIIRGAGQAQYIERAMQGYYSTSPQPSVEMVMLNHAQPPFDDRRVRRALALASGIGGDSHVELSSFATMHSTFIPPGFKGTFEPEPPDYTALSDSERIAQARQIMSALGYSDDNPLRFTYKINVNQQHRRMANLLRSRWNRVFFDVKIIEQDWADQVDDLVNTGNYQAGRIAWVYDYPHSLSILDIFAADARYNMANFTDETYDQLLTEIRNTADLTKAYDLKQEALDRLYDEVAAIPVYTFEEVVLAQPDLKFGAPTFYGDYLWHQIHYPQALDPPS